MRMCTRLVATAALAALAALPAAAQDAAGAGATSDDAPAYVWVEGERPSAGEGLPHGWYSGRVETRLLSGRAFLSAYGGDADTEVAYDVDVPAAARWTLWARCNPVKARVEWRIGGGAWRDAPLERAVDQVNIAADGTPDMRFLAWVPCGEVELPRGPVRVEFALRGEVEHHGALDCFVLARAPFVPQGRRRPDAPLTDAAPGWFAFDPGHDPLRDDALLDLRGLNETRAGESGPLRRDGDRIVLGDGTPVRFWGANAGPAATHEATQYLARRLAKTGFNLARLHGPLVRQGDPRTADPARIDALQHAVAAFRDEGIYSELSFWFPLWLRYDDGFAAPGAPKGANPFALLYLDADFRATWKGWATALLTTPNPYTGVPLAQDPAVGFVEIQNEDSLLFWTFKKETLGPELWERAERLFAAWAARRHGSEDAALAAWPGAHQDTDTPGRLGLLPLWNLTADGLAAATPGLAARAREQALFLAELQRDVHAELTRHLRDLGYRGLVVAGNWQTADDAALLGLERWSYTPGDVVDRHGYFGALHKGKAAAYSVRVGDQCGDASALATPTATPLPVVQIAGLPHMHSENAWNRPNALVADGPLLVAGYAALQGLDGWVWFRAVDGEWLTSPTEKWPLFSAANVGQSPATALLYRRGDVREGPVVLRRVARVDDLAPPSGGFAEGRSADFRATGGRDAALSLERLAPFVGRVECAIPGVGGATGDAQLVGADLTRYADLGASRVTSATSELTLDWGRALLTVDTACSQAVAGRLADAGEIRLGDVTIRCGNTYAAVHVVSLDGLPLATSQRMLVQAFSRERMWGFEVHEGKVAALGAPPLEVERIDAEVHFANAAHLAAVRLDGNGYMTAGVRVADGRVRLPADGLYTLVTR